ncbi:MAG: substrate-binding domain-containing protein [Oscillospiraceae bacterium]|nr:substrate-binding domain-containing protein [Oscillospiraceae bacterium]
MNRKKTGIIGRLAAGALALSMAAVSSGCQQQAQSNGTIYVIAQTRGVQFWDLLKVGTEDAANELNYTIAYFDTESANDVDAQRTYIQQAIANDAKGIVIAPWSATELNSELEKAYTAQIPVITVSSSATYPGVDSYVGSDNTAAGQIAGRQLASVLPDGGDIVIIGHSATAANATGRIQGFIDSVNAINAQYKAAYGEQNTSIKDPYNLVTTEYSNGQRDGTKELAAQALKEHPDLKLIYATNENSTLGVCDAISEAGKTGQVKVIGFNSNDAELNYIQQGVLTGTMVQSPYNMGYLGVRFIDKLQSNEEIRSNYDTGAIYVTSSNLNDDIIQLWIHPDKQ